MDYLAFHLFRPRHAHVGFMFLHVFRRFVFPVCHIWTRRDWLTEIRRNCRQISGPDRRTVPTKSFSPTAVANITISCVLYRTERVWAQRVSPSRFVFGHPSCRRRSDNNNNMPRAFLLSSLWTKTDQKIPSEDTQRRYEDDFFCFSFPKVASLRHSLGVYCRVHDDLNTAVGLFLHYELRTTR